MIGRRAFWLGAAGSAGFLAVFAYFFVDFDTIGDVLRTANYVYIAPSLVFYFAAVYFRTMRWRFLLNPLMGPTTRALYPVVVVGYMANNLIPVRIGEVLRSVYVSLREPVDAAAAFGTVAVERAFDVVALLFFVAVAWLFLPVSGVLDRVAESIPGGTTVLIVVSILPFGAVAAVLIVVAFVSSESVLRVIERLLAPVPERARGPLMGLIARLLDGLTAIRSPRGLLALFLLSLPVWLLEAGMYYLISLGFDVGSVFGGSGEVIAVILVFTAAANLAGVFPSSAGSWGPFDFFGAAALIALGVENSVATGYAVTVHVALWVPVTLLGAVLLLADGTSLGQLMERSSAGRIAARGVAGTDKEDGG